jgi:uncharacterized protein YrrD
LSDPVSWLVVERGWDVYGSDGERIGAMDELVGDSGKDIFNGLVLSEGLFKGRRYVPAEQVAQITEGRVELSIPSTQELREWDGSPPSEEILAPDPKR